MRFRVYNEEVIFSAESVIRIGNQDIEDLRERAKKTLRQRARICTHRDVKEGVHEMLIVHKRGVYVPPHKHTNRSESFHVIEGLADVVLFDENGAVVRVIEMGERASGRHFYYRLSEPQYHSLLVRTAWFIFHEVTNGPFDRADTVFPPWAPEEGDEVGQMEFMKRMAAAAGAAAGNGTKMAVSPSATQAEKLESTA